MDHKAGMKDIPALGVLLTDQSEPLHLDYSTHFTWTVNVCEEKNVRERERERAKEELRDIDKLKRWVEI